MKYLILLCTSFYCLNSHAQYAIQDVYDFDPGDVLETESKTYGVNVPHFSYDSLIDKYYTTGNDTLVYVFQKNFFIPPTFPNGPFTSEVYLDTMRCTQLSSPALHYQGAVCDNVNNDTIVDDCGNEKNRVGAQNNNCFEMEQWYSELVLGLGGPYYYSFVPGENAVSYHRLIYYKTLDKGECGQRFSFLSTNEFDSNQVQVYPTITTDFLNVPIKKLGEESIYVVYNSLGQQVKTGIVHPILSVSDLESGIYVLTIQSLYSSSSFRFIKN